MDLYFNLDAKIQRIYVDSQLELTMKIVYCMNPLMYIYI